MRYVTIGLVFWTLAACTTTENLVVDPRLAPEVFQSLSDGGSSLAFLRSAAEVGVPVQRFVPSGDSIVFSYRGRQWSVPGDELVQVRHRRRQFSPRLAFIGGLVGSAFGATLASMLARKEPYEACVQWGGWFGLECMRFETRYRNDPRAASTGAILGVPAGAALLGFFGHRQVTVYRFGKAALAAGPMKASLRIDVGRSAGRK